MGILNNHIDNKIRLEVEDLIVYEPKSNDIAIIKGIVEKMNINSGLSVEGTVGSEMTRYLISKLTNIGDEIDQYTDEELEQKLNNGDRVLRLVLRELTKIVSEVVEDMQHEQLIQIEMITSILNNVKSKNKLEENLKELGINSVEELESGEWAEKFNNVKKQSKKRTNKK